MSPSSSFREKGLQRYKIPRTIHHDFPIIFCYNYVKKDKPQINKQIQKL